MSDNDSQPFDLSTFMGGHLEHIRTCKARPCTRCDLDLCACGADMLRSGTLRDVAGESRVIRSCEACADKEVLRLRIKRVRDTIPEDFGWAKLGARELGERSSATRAQIKDAWDECVLGRRSLVLSGPAGAGKTSVVIALFRALFERGIKEGAPEKDKRRALSAGYFSVYDLARDRAKHGLGDESPMVKRAIGASVAVIDDLGNETDTALSAVPEILYERHAQGRPTWITTWMTQDDAQRRYNGGVARRIFERATVLYLQKRA